MPASQVPRLDVSHPLDRLSGFIGSGSRTRIQFTKAYGSGKVPAHLVPLRLPTMVRYLLPGTSVPWLVPKSILLLTLRLLMLSLQTKIEGASQYCYGQKTGVLCVFKTMEDFLPFYPSLPEQVSKIRLRLVLTRSDAKGATYTPLLIHEGSNC